MPETLWPQQSQKSEVRKSAPGRPATKSRSWITTKGEQGGKENEAGAPGRDSPGGVHDPLGLSMNKMAMALRVPVTRIADIVNERRGITADTALRFARYFKNSPGFWMNLQTRYDLEVAEDEIAAKVTRDVQPLETVTAREV